MTSPTYLINGISLGDALGPLFLVRASMWRPDVSMVRSVLSVPGRHGSIRTGGLPVHSEAKLTIVVTATAGASQADLEQAVNRFQALLDNPTLVLTRISGGLTTEAEVESEGISHQGFVTGRSDTMTATLAIPSVFLSEPPAISAPILVPAPATNLLLPHLSGASAPMADSIVRITGPWTDPVIACSNSKTGVRWTGEVPGGQYLYLDPQRLRARLSSSADAWLSGGTDVSQHIDYPPAGRLQLWPKVTPGGSSAFADASAPQVRIDAGGSGLSGASAVTVRAGRSFL